MRRLTRHTPASTITIAALALALVGAAPALAASVWDVDTTGAIDTTVGSFGLPNTATYGQTITVPAGPAELSTFSFDMDVPATVVFRGAIQAWDGTAGMATGPVLYLSDPMSTSGTGMETITFSPNIPITPGEYVLYATVSYDYVPDVEDAGDWAIASGDAYDGGAFVYMNNGGDVDALTTAAWDVWSGSDDTGFTVVYAAPAVVVVPSAPVAVPVVVAPAFTG